MKEVSNLAIALNPWKNKDWFVCPHNFDHAIMTEWRLPSEVRIHDTTLRDGEQQPGLVFRKEEKVKAGILMDELGIAEIEAGMPVVSNEDFEAIRELSQAGLKSRLMCLVRITKQDIDVAVDAGVSGVVIEVPSSYEIHGALGWDSEEIILKSAEAVAYAKDRGLYVSFFPWDSTRADIEYWLRISSAAVEAGADIVAFVDTLGVAHPQAIFHLVRKIKNDVKAPIEIHCHNDFGMATANSLAAVAAGAEVVDTSFIGLGERCGNAATEEVALALKLLYGINIRLNFSKIYSMSQYVQEIAGIRVPPMKPVVGDNVNAIEVGLALDIITKAKTKGMDELVMLPYRGQIVGQRGLKMVIGKKSGKRIVEWKLREMGIEITDEQINKVLAQIKDYAINVKRGLSDQEVKDIVSKTIGVP
jgi:methanogen homocitrate synthase